MTEVRLDRVFTFGDQLSFLIPHEWIEEDGEPDHYLYHLPNTDSGWLRVSLLTLTHLGTTWRERLLKLLEERAHKEEGDLYEAGENFVVAWEKASEQDEVPIYLYWWAVAHCHDSGLGQEALFSYTILHDRREDPGTRETVSLVAELVANARFAEPKVI